MQSIPISALQHYVFCPRQCAYIHVEKLWRDNYLTAKGNQLHERVHSNEAETRGDLRTERGAQIVSEKQGIHGVLDLLEIRQTDGEPQYTPVEYKRGKPKISDCDRVQLCAQALCLEDMQNTHIPKAALWYWQVRKREWVELDESLRELTLTTIAATRELLNQQTLPKAHYTKACNACSFIDTCQPKLTDRSADYRQNLFNL